MQLLMHRPGFRVWIDEITDPADWQSPCADQFFALLLYADHAAFDASARRQLCKSLVTAGCRHALLAGEAHEDWHMGMDWAYLMPFDTFNPQYTPPEDKFLMTSGVFDLSLADTIEFLFNTTSFDDWVPENFVILIVGRNPQLRQDLSAAVRAYLGDDASYRATMLLRQTLEKVRTNETAEKRGPSNNSTNN